MQCFCVEQLKNQVASGGRDAEAVDPEHGRGRERCNRALSSSGDCSKQGESHMTKTHRFIVKPNLQAEFTDMEPSRTRQLEEFYSCVLRKSRLQWKLEATAGPNNGAAGDGGLKPHLVYVADMEGEREEALSKRHAPDQR